MTSRRLVGETSPHQDLETLGVSRRLVRSVSQKLKKKVHRAEAEEEDETGGVSMRCLSLYGRGGGCKVGADTTEETGDSCGKRQSSASEEGKAYTAARGIRKTTADCFTYGVGKTFWKKTNKRVFKLKESEKNSSMNVFLPDDILEMCLMRLPLTSLMTARLVCKKWRNITTASRFMLMRREALYQTPWLFLFGFVKDGYCSGEIHSLDVSLNQWHKIDAGLLRGRFMFSVASIRENIYIVGGCSSLTHLGKMDRSSFRTHKGVLLFSPMAKSWQKVASMKYARSSPVLGTYEISFDCSIMKNQQAWQGRCLLRPHAGGVLDVYEDPHRISVRRQYRSSLSETEVPFCPTKPYKFVRQQSDHSNEKKHRRFMLIAVGGLGNHDEPLVSGEIYDSLSNKWMEIQRLPIDFGIVCAGVVCNGIFYVYSEEDKLAGYDIERGFWVGINTTACPPRVHEYYPQLISCSKRLFMLSVSWCEGDGEIGRRNKAVRKLWELDLTYLSWSEVSVHPDAPMDWNAVFVADRNMIFGVEMFKIFGQVLDFVTAYDVSSAETVWRHVSRNHVAQELDAASCITKSMALLYL